MSIEQRIKRSLLLSLLGGHCFSGDRHTPPGTGLRRGLELAEPLREHLISLGGHFSHPSAEPTIKALVPESSLIETLLEHLVKQVRFSVNGRHVCIDDDDWRDWRDLTFGLDPKTLVLMAWRGILTEDPDAGTPDLTIVHPRGSILVKAIEDWHIHLGAIPLPGHVWATLLTHGRRNPVDPRPSEIKPDVSEFGRQLARYGALARMFLSILKMELIDEEFSTVFIKDQGSIVKAVTAHLHGPLAPAPQQILKNILSDPLARQKIEPALSPGPLWKMGVREVDDLETKILAMGLKGFFRGNLSHVQREILLTYLWIKNDWFSSLSGSSNRSPHDEALGLRRFRQLNELRRDSLPDPDELLTYHFPLADRVADFHADSASGQLDVRLSVTRPANVTNLIHYLKRCTRDRPVRIFLGVSRVDDSFERKSRGWKQDLERFAEFVDALMKADLDAAVIQGIDIFGYEGACDWIRYGDLLVSMHNKLVDTGCPEPIVSFHCGEDSPCLLKGRLDLLFMVTRKDLPNSLRVGHCLDLFRKVPPREAEGPFEIANMIYINMGRVHSKIIASAKDDYPVEIAELENAWQQLDSNLVEQSGNGVTVPVMEYFKCCEVVAQLLLKVMLSKSVVVECCPTSNWQITDIPSPEDHPISSFIERGGSVQAGTDDPLVFPTTIGTERWYLARLRATDDA